jgi:methylglutaconyl-CoA hydratase
MAQFSRSIFVARSIITTRPTFKVIGVFTRAYSARSSTIETETIPAPNIGHIKVIKLNRPEARNAISRELLDNLNTEISNIDFSPTKTRVLIVASAVPGIFCAGADLKERKTFTLDE